MTKKFCIVYRTGGYDNFKWSRSLAFTTYTQANWVAALCKRAGYEAHVESFDMSNKIGLPETFDYPEQIA